MQEVIHEMYTDLHQLNQPVEAFYNRFRILAEARHPQLPPKQLCIDFSSKLSPEYGTYCILAEENPGRGDFNQFADKVINLIHSTTARELLHERQTGGNRVNGMIAGSEWMAPYRKPFDSFGTQVNSAFQTAIESAVQAELHNLGLGSQVGAFATNAKGGKGAQSAPRSCINCGSTTHRFKECIMPDAKCSHPFCVEKGLTRHLEKYCFYLHPEQIQYAPIRERVLKELEAGKPILPVSKVEAHIVFIDGEGHQFDGEDCGDFQALLTTTNGLPALPTNLCSAELFSSPHFFEYMVDGLASPAIDFTNPNQLVHKPRLVADGHALSVEMGSEGEDFSSYIDVSLPAPALK